MINAYILCNVAPNNDEASRFTGRHFPAKWVSEDGKSKPRACKVCVPAERKLQEGKPKKQRYGCETVYKCKQCNVRLCPEFCFELYHSRKDFVARYCELRT